ncbi:hypothetical protein GCM10009535_16440 [Streptomyces thermocarboxydovorans]|uniref:Transcription regulator AsnC/Lrp ligand binding domain-containing protein n=1 Tax=Streptomyces thermocarboxydovorans TaxID=59298 RepID=A0ABN1HDR9_9ACTN
MPGVPGRRSTLQPSHTRYADPAAVSAVSRAGEPATRTASPAAAGEPDYLLRVVAADLAAYQRLYDERLATLPGVQRLTSTLVMKHVVKDRPLPARQHKVPHNATGGGPPG